MKLLQINSGVNIGSTGRIAEEIGKILISRGHESYIAFGRGFRPSASHLIRIGNKWDLRFHGLKSRILDLHGFGSRNATRNFIEKVKAINPDIIHLHNVHGYYLNIDELFTYLRSAGKPVVWTLHDCWAFTGHCTYFDAVNCFKWQHLCHKCPNLHGYPESWCRDNTKKNYYEKRRLFVSIESLTIVTPSLWLASNVSKSFLRDFSIKTIFNGTDLSVFKPSNPSTFIKEYGLAIGEIVLGVANTWDSRKGLADFIKLRKSLSERIQIVLVGLNQQQIDNLQTGIIGISRVESTGELAAIYSAASVYVNPTYVDNFPTTNIEALACGTPVITYNTGGSPEAIDENTGFILEKGDITGLFHAIEEILAKGKEFYQVQCRSRAEKMYNKDDRFIEYLDTYQALVNKE